MQRSGMAHCEGLPSVRHTALTLLASFVLWLYFLFCEYKESPGIELATTWKHVQKQEWMPSWGAVVDGAKWALPLFNSHLMFEMTFLCCQCFACTYFAGIYGLVTKVNQTNTRPSASYKIAFTLVNCDGFSKSTSWTGWDYCTFQ